MPAPINISASRSAAVLGQSKWSTPVQAWLQIMGEDYCREHGYEYPVVEYSPAMRWGHAFESAIIELAEYAQGQPITDREGLYTAHDYLTCHIDGRYSLETLHEGKTTNIRSFRDEWGEPGSDRIPREYMLQCQHQMICTGADTVIVSVLVFPRMVDEWEAMGWMPDCGSDGIWSLDFTEPGETDGIYIMPSQWAHILNQMGYFHQYTIHAHPELQQLMLEKYREFWHYVETATPPPVREYDDIRALVRDPVGTIVCDEEMARMIAEYRHIGTEISATGSLARRRDELKVAVLDRARMQGAVVDDESQDKWILRDQQGRKLGSYGKDKNGRLGFR